MHPIHQLLPNLHIKSTKTDFKKAYQYLQTHANAATRCITKLENIIYALFYLPFEYAQAPEGYYTICEMIIHK